jgi:hypothetical protein
MFHLLWKSPVAWPLTAPRRRAVSQDVWAKAEFDHPQKEGVGSRALT